jgi:adenylate cyclase
MIRLSIKRKIIGIALILIALMTVTALISLALVMQVSGRLEELSRSYAPAYASLARADIHSLERALALRRMVIDRREQVQDEAHYADARKRFEESGVSSIGSSKQRALCSMA